MENHHFQWVNQLQMAIFNSYIGLPEGTPKQWLHLLLNWSQFNQPGGHYILLLRDWHGHVHSTAWSVNLQYLSLFLIYSFKGKCVVSASASSMCPVDSFFFLLRPATNRLDCISAVHWNSSSFKKGIISPLFGKNSAHLLPSNRKLISYLDVGQNPWPLKSLNHCISDHLNARIKDFDKS